MSTSHRTTKPLPLHLSDGQADPLDGLSRTLSMLSMVHMERPCDGVMFVWRDAESRKDAPMNNVIIGWVPLDSFDTTGTVRSDHVEFFYPDGSHEYVTAKYAEIAVADYFGSI